MLQYDFSRYRKVQPDFFTRDTGKLTNIHQIIVPKFTGDAGKTMICLERMCTSAACLMGRPTDCDHSLNKQTFVSIYDDEIKSMKRRSKNGEYQPE